MADDRKATAKEVLTELKRELTIRKRLYPEWEKSGKIHKAVADQRVAAMQQAIADLEIYYGSGEQERLI